MREAFIFLCADGSLRQVNHAQRQTLHHQKVERFDARGAPSTLGGSDPLQIASGDFLQEEGGVADFSEAGCDGCES